MVDFCVQCDTYCSQSAKKYVPKIVYLEHTKSCFIENNFFPAQLQFFPLNQRVQKCSLIIIKNTHTEIFFQLILNRKWVWTNDNNIHDKIMLIFQCCIPKHKNRNRKNYYELIIIACQCALCSTKIFSNSLADLVFFLLFKLQKR